MLETRIKTGVPQFDTMLRGGFMRGDAVMLSGSAGTGKTTLALQYLTAGIAAGENGLYLTFEELPDQIYRDAKNFGWDLRKMEAENKLRVVCTAPDLIMGEGDLEALLAEQLREIQPQRVVVDSLSHLQMYAKEGDMRKEAYRMIMFFKNKKISSLLLWEAPQVMGSSFAISDVGMSFLVDTIVALKFIEIESSIHKAMVVLKMRGSDHEKALREYEITPGGIKVEGTFKQYEGLMSGAPTRSASDRFVELFGKAAKSK